MNDTVTQGPSQANGKPRFPDSWCQATVHPFAAPPVWLLSPALPQPCTPTPVLSLGTWQGVRSDVVSTKEGADEPGTSRVTTVKSRDRPAGHRMG